MNGFLKSCFKNMLFSHLKQISRFQTSGSDPGEDLCMQNSILRSTNANSFNQGRKNRKHEFQQFQKLIV